MSNNNAQLQKIPCGGFQIGSGLSLAGGVLSAESTGGGIMSFETMREYIEYCKEHGGVIAYVTKEIAPEEQELERDINFPVICVGYDVVETQIPDGVIPMYYGFCIDNKGFAIVGELGAGKMNIERYYDSFVISDNHFYGKNNFGRANLITSLTVAYGLYNYNKIEGYYLESYVFPIRTLKSYNGKTTATITGLNTPTEDGFDYTITITENK